MLLLGLCASTTNHRCVPLYSYGMYPNATVYKCSMWCAVGCVVTPLCIMYNTQHLYCRHWCVHVGCVCVCAYVFVWHKEGKCLNCTVHWSDDAAYRILLYYTAETNGVCKRFWPRTRTFVYLEHKQFVLDIIRVPSVSCGAASTINNKYSSTYNGLFARSIRFDSIIFFGAIKSHSVFEENFRQIICACKNKKYIWLTLCAVGLWIIVT